MTKQEFESNISMGAMYLNEANKYIDYIKPYLVDYTHKILCKDISTLNRRFARHFLEYNVDLQNNMDEIGAYFYDVFEAIRNQPKKRNELIALLKAFADNQIKIKP